MEIKTVKIDSIIPYVNNARTHSEEQISQIAASIKEFGFNNPVLLDGDNGIIAGHGRVLAARKLGIDNLPVIELCHLSESQKKAYILADNRIAENAGWDMELVNIEIESLANDNFDVVITGFDLDIETPDFQPVGEDEQGKLDILDPKIIVCPHCNREFDERKL